MVPGFPSWAADGRLLLEMLEGGTCRAEAAHKEVARRVCAQLRWLAWQDPALTVFPSPPCLLFEHCSSFRCDWKRAVNRLGVWNALALSEDTQGRRWHVSDVLCVIPKAKTLPLTTGGSPQGLSKASALSAIIQPGDNVCHYLKRHHWQSDVIFTYLPFFENQILFFFICLTTWLPENARGM